ncbi:proprotein convertase subtilisin/kexin type 5-like [Ruditapes philippinarum]|uniref:proprotein convertase subtilisin/kexin type 5-like n=1 Tax=Ruditapes philippinarum TaxID=129788 RepID=UPI00295B56D5|nr:proprotein convertase subtilisin/kexin type 5-like [Ruditapes philippinarum]
MAVSIANEIKKCVDTCPLDRQYIVNRSCQRDECKTKYRFYNSTGIKCFDTCPSNLFFSNTTCVFQCLNNQYVFDQTCVRFCPSSHAIIDERHIAMEQYNCYSGICAKHVAVFKECRASCPPEKFLFNKECKNVCPNNTVIHANRCVKVCPNTHLKVEKTEVAISTWFKQWWSLATDKWVLRNETVETSQCVSQCSERYPLQFHNSCVRKCPKDVPYQINGMCVESCPGNKLNNLTTKVCVDQCAKTVGEFNRSCYSRCPKHIKYIFNARCVSECPSSHPVALEKDRFVCRKSCGDSKLFRDGECIESYLCDDPMFEYNDKCLHRCPEGLVWLGECRHTLVPKIFVGILCFLLLPLIILSRQLLPDFKMAARLVFMSYEMIEEEEKRLIQSESNSKLKEKNRGAEDVISLHELIPHMEDEHTF